MSYLYQYPLGYVNISGDVLTKEQEQERRMSCLFAENDEVCEKCVEDNWPCSFACGRDNDFAVTDNEWCIINCRCINCNEGVS